MYRVQFCTDQLVGRAVKFEIRVSFSNLEGSRRLMLFGKLVGRKLDQFCWLVISEIGRIRVLVV